MKFLTSAFIILLLSVGLANSAHALWIEPYAGFEMGDHEQGNTSYDASGLNLGIKGGGTLSSVNLGIEYALGDMTVEFDNGKENFKTTDLGLYVGTELSSIRLWFVYWFDSEANTEDRGDYEGDGGFKFGLGFNAFSSVTFNVEKTLRKWTESDGNKLNQKIELDGVLVSLSLPFTF